MLCAVNRAAAPKLQALDTGLALSTMAFDTSELKRWPLDKILVGGVLHYRLVSLPLYLASCVPDMC
jgi:hypothetical protein